MNKAAKQRSPSREAQVANGEYCQTCEKFLAGFGTGKPRTCYQCDDLAKIHGTVGHDKLIRCPSCRQQFEGPQWPRGIDGKDVDRGDVAIECESCGHEFRVEIEISVSFHSPAICEHEWEETGGAGDEHVTEKYERCKRCKAERTTETPRTEAAS